MPWKFEASKSHSTTEETLEFYKTATIFSQMSHNLKLYTQWVFFLSNTKFLSM